MKSLWNDAEAATFDVTLAELITAIVCEKGVALQPNSERIRLLLN